MSMNMAIGTITKKGQITVPATVRKHLHLRPNDKLAFEIRGNEVVVSKPKLLSLDDVFGVVPPRTRPEDFKALRDTAMEERLERNRSLKP